MLDGRFRTGTQYPRSEQNLPAHNLAALYLETWYRFHTLNEIFETRVNQYVAKCKSLTPTGQEITGRKYVLLKNVDLLLLEPVRWLAYIITINFRILWHSQPQNKPA